jgi:hypothetical protein
MEKIQAALDSGAVPELVYGRNEPALVYFHRSIDAALDSSPSVLRRRIAATR